MYFFLNYNNFYINLQFYNLIAIYDPFKEDFRHH